MSFSEMYFQFSVALLSSLLVQELETNLYSTSVSLQLLYLGQLHNGGADVAQSFAGQVGAGDVLEVRAQIDSRILLGKSICS